MITIPGRPRRVASFRVWALACVITVAVGAGFHANGSDALAPPDVRDRPRLSIDGGDVVVTMTHPTGVVRRTVLREASEIGAAGAVPRRTGVVVPGLAAYATWTESGEVWYALTRDGGVTWTPPSARRSELRLRDGATGPTDPMPAARFPAAPDGRTFIVQFETIAIPEWRTALEATGARILRYLPHNAYITRVPRAAKRSAVLEAVRGLSFVARVEPLHASYRIGPELRDLASRVGRASGAPAEGEPGVVRIDVVTFERDLDAKRRVAALARELGAGRVHLFPNGHLLELDLPAGAIPTLAAHDDVLWIGRHQEPETDMDLVREDSGVDHVENTLGYCGQGVRAEVFDSGFQTDHPDFDGVMLHGTVSANDHGTSTYGILFGNGDTDGDGDPRALGQLWCGQGIIADYDLLADRFAHTQELLADPYFASFQSNSWGNGTTTAYNAVSFDLDDIIWRLDFTILQSQSNRGNALSRPQAWAKNIISVGGIQHLNTLDTSDDGWFGVASIGPAQDGRVKPDLSYWNDAIFTTTIGSTYREDFGGTSASTPQVAGVVGLILQMWSEDVWGTSPTGATVFERKPNFATVKALLVNSVEQYPFSGPGDDLTRMHQGWGRPDARVAYERAATSFVVDRGGALEVGDADVSHVDVQAGEAELRVTMTYPDPPGIIVSNLHRINDLDLRVTSPSGVVYHGNVGLLDGTVSVPGGSPNGVDTVENVFVANPEAGTWQVRVRASEINEDADLSTPQFDANYSLVVTGATGALCDPPTTVVSVTPNPARVGQTILFEADPSGGGGAPFEIAWDFDDDGTIDATGGSAEHVYVRPYAGDVRVRVGDAGECEDRQDIAMQVTGPDLRYDDFVDLTEVSGNANGAFDPGEVWDLRVRLRNDGDETALGTRAAIAIAPETPASAYAVRPWSTFPDIAPGTTAASDVAYRIQIGDDFPCGSDIVLDVVAIGTGDPSNDYPDEPGVMRFLVGGVGPAIAFFADDFEASSGWGPDGGGEWEIGPPQGLGIGGWGDPDPSTAFQGSRVLGNDLSGQGTFSGRYENDIESYMFSPFIDGSDASNVELHYASWLNSAPLDLATVEINPDGSSSNWVRVRTELTGFTSTSWTESTIDVSDLVDGQPFFRVRFGIRSDGNTTASGWNVDDVRFTGVTNESCEPFARTNPGAVHGLRIGRAGPGQIELTWFPDCGGGASYGIYRGDLASGYASIASEPGACSVAGTSFVAPEGGGSADFFLVVPRDATSEGSYGADGSGTARSPAASPCAASGGIDACAP